MAHQVHDAGVGRGARLMTALETVERYVAFINAHDVTGLSSLMTPDHRFVDALGASVTGRDAMREAWEQYFQMFPDYHIDVSHALTDEGLVVLLGSAQGTCRRAGRVDPSDSWQMPAAWRALVRDGRVAEWQVYADNEPVRQRMTRAPGEPAG